MSSEMVVALSRSLVLGFRSGWILGFWAGGPDGFWDFGSFASVMAFVSWDFGRFASVSEVSGLWRLRAVPSIRLALMSCSGLPPLSLYVCSTHFSALSSLSLPFWRISLTLIVSSGGKGRVTKT
jgi:hypothetical protein